MRNYFSSDRGCNSFDKYDTRLCTASLSDTIGLLSLYRSEQLYKSLYNFFIECNENMDLEPPVEVGNTSKINKYGFDTKTSFRHPVK